ncbi:hypothetical protein ACH4F6_32780 [Streptomyces sp. NPDC017936]|uniref:hypothetical protein n=1 Tax=Streptomyces sp. NPDC017936 TaxID=3365016 RepID=UPI0037B68B25
MIYVTLRLYEDTNVTNTDLDAELDFNRYVPAGQISTLSEITLRSGENGGKDWAKLNLSPCTTTADGTPGRVTWFTGPPGSAAVPGSSGRGNRSHGSHLREQHPATTLGASLGP